MSEPRLTVVLVTFNHRQRVEELLLALEGFTRSPFDLIAVDNASSDGTLELLRARSGRPGFLLVENQENLHCARATNQALALVRTEYLVYLCASHALVTAPGWELPLLEYMDAHPDLLLAGDVWDPYGFTHPSRRYKAGWTPEAHGRARLRHVQGGAFVARTRLFEALGGFASDEYPHGGMDVELSYRLLSHGHELGRVPEISCPPAPQAARADALVVHPASEETRARVCEALGASRPTASTAPANPRAGSTAVAGTRPAALVFCERVENESFCAAVVRELERSYEVRPCGPGWPVERLLDQDLQAVRFYLELDAVTGGFVRPEGLERLSCPKFAWLVDTHKKTAFHQAIAREVDLTFFAHRAWGHVFGRPCAWLPLHADQELWRPEERERDLDLVFVGSQPWRAEPLERIARRHGLRLLVERTTGQREKSRCAALYARAKLVFNRHVTNDLNFRVFEALACGRVLLTDAQQNGQYELFEEDRHLVYWKDERDLERQVLRLLADEGLRARIEREAALVAQIRHTTRARVDQLVQAIEAHLAAREVPVRVEVVGGPVSPVSPAGTEALPRGRWLVIADEEPEAVVLESWAERSARELRALGQEVTVARERRGRLQRRGPGLLELERGALPAALSASNAMLAGAGPFERRLSQALEGERPDAILAEGPLGGIVGPSLARRLGAPLVYLLRDCEVLRRRNRLTREQLYLSELEGWACERAAVVLAPSDEVAAGARAHYKVQDPWLVPVPPADPARGAPGELLRRLGLEGQSYLLLLGADLCSARVATALGRRLDRPLLLAGEALWLAAPRREPVLVARAGARGPALGALLGAAAEVLLADRGCERRRDALALARRVSLVDPERVLEGDWFETRQPLPQLEHARSYRALAAQLLGRTAMPGREEVQRELALAS